MLASSRNIVRFLFAWALVLVAFTVASPSRADIKTPGDHPDYSVELEPHFVLQWDNGYYANASDGIGLGGRVSFPIIKQGPIRTINNSFAIGVGLDWVFFGNDCGYYVRGNNVVIGRGWNCSGNQLHIPVVAQWNFYFTRVISLFGEAGFAIRHASFDVGCGPGVNGPYCGSVSDTGLEGVFAVGPRFSIADSFAITLRVGYPYFSAGVSFFL